MELTAGVAISLHLFLNGEYNPIHPHVRLESPSITSGVYLNSTKNISFYLSKTFDINKDYELEIGAVTGYESHGLVIPMVRIKKGNFFISPVIEKWDDEKNPGLLVSYQF
jgi:hypothetical protein